MAVLKREKGWVELRAALLGAPGYVPAPVLVEFWRVARRGNLISPDLLAAFLDEMLADSEILAFSAEHAESAAAGGEAHGTGNGNGGLLNMLDLMVYGVAKVENLPILCTGYNFATTGAAIHPASRIG